MLTRERIVQEIEQALSDREAPRLKWFAQDALTSREDWEHGAEYLIGEALHALAEWGEPNWPIGDDEAWEIAQTLKTWSNPEDALDQLLLLFQEPRFEKRRAFREKPAVGGFQLSRPTKYSAR